MRLIFLGLSITSSWGNGHATNYRALVRALASRGHDVLFLERDVPWYAAHRDLPEPPWGSTALYRSVEELRESFTGDIADAELVLVGSYVPQGTTVAEWVLDHAGGAVAFWDMDTPVTVAKLAADEDDYLSRALVPRFDLYLSFTGGPLLHRIEQEFGARRARPFYCTADLDAYRPLEERERWLLGYMGTYSEDRQAGLESLLVEPARRLRHRRFVVAGAQFPPDLTWPRNVERIGHLPPGEHARFYARQRLALNVTRAAMVRSGWAPSVRLFEAASCGTPVVSDWWDGLDRFFHPGAEILVARSADDIAEIVGGLSQDEARRIGAAARDRVLTEHTPARRVEELEGHVRALADASA